MRYFLWKLPNPNIYWLSRGQTDPTECYIKDRNYWENANRIVYVGDGNTESGTSNWIKSYSVEISYQEAVRVLLNQNQETVDLILREKQK